MRDPERILIIRPSALGDVCRSVPVLVSLRRAYPRARIDWVVQDTFADAIRHHPDLNECVLFHRREMGSSIRRGRAGGVLRWLRDLRRRRYDLVIEAQGLARSGLFAWVTRAPRRVGLRDARELGWLGCNVRVAVPPGAHAVERMLELVRALGAPAIPEMRLYTGAADRVWVRTHEALCHGPYGVIAPTSRWPGKRWPGDRFAHVCRRLLDGDPSAPGRALDAVVIVGAPGEENQCAPLLDLAAREPRVLNLIGRTSVGQLMALVQHAAIVIGNDSAALHMAVGFDRPLVGLYGPTRVELVGPFGRQRDVIQHLRPRDALNHKDEAAGRALMERIRIEEVLGAARSRLDRARTHEPPCVRPGERPRA